MTSQKRSRAELKVMAPAAGLCCCTPAPCARTAGSRVLWGPERFWPFLSCSAAEVAAPSRAAPRFLSVGLRLLPRGWDDPEGVRKEGGRDAQGCRQRGSVRSEGVGMDGQEAARYLRASGRSGPAPRTAPRARGSLPAAEAEAVPSRGRAEPALGAGP